MFQGETLMPAATTKRPSFAADERGAVAMMFGIIFFVFFFSAGMAIDYARIVHFKSRLAVALDAAALAAGKAMLDGRLSDSEVLAIAERYFTENVEAGGENFGTIAALNVQLDRSVGGVTIDVDAQVPMTFTRIAGYEQVNLPLSTAARFDQKDIELGMQLDLTGSMCSPCSKRDALRTATRDLIDILLPDAGTPNSVRIGFAPFSAGVNLGPYASIATDGQNGGSNCVYDRHGSNDTTDAPPSAGNFFKGLPELPGAGNCPGTRLVPLTDDKNLLKATAAGLTTGGTTAGQAGTNWAWNLISPNWSGVWPNSAIPAPYNDGHTVKAVVLMTDGEYNTFDGRCDAGGCTPYGTRGRKSNDQAKAMCQNMKQQDVIVFTVGFMLNHPAAAETLGECATSPQHYFRAENGDELRAAFAAIAVQLNNLRLTR